jgi:phage terminase small subunit
MALAVEEKRSPVFVGSIPQVLPSDSELTQDIAQSNCHDEPLRNAKREKFAQLIAAGVSQGKAYVQAGYSPNGADEAAYKLIRVAQVRTRISAIQRQITQKTIQNTALDRAWVLASLKENADRAMQAEPVLDSKGRPTGEYQWNGNVANRALELIGKELGMFKEQIEVADVTKRLEALQQGRERARRALEAAEQE